MEERETVQGEEETSRRRPLLKEGQEVVLIANWPWRDDGWSIGDH